MPAPRALVLVLAALCACTDPPAGGGLDVDLPGDVAPEVGPTIDAAEDATADVPADVPPDVEAPDLVAPDTGPVCPGGAGCACTSHGDCDGGFCLDGPDGKQCAYSCAGDCPAGYTCAQVNVGGGSDTTSICVPRYGWRCDPCSVSGQCAAAGHPDARCVSYGPAGSFCGVACASDGDCGEGYACQAAPLVEGGSSKQCVKTGDGTAPGVCPCSKRATQQALSTACQTSFPSTGDPALCQGFRACKAEGEAGLSPCDAAPPVGETCNGADDDCDGKTDEATCDDANPCTSDSCDPGAGSDGCVHQPNDGFVCDDGNACSAGDQCQGGQCQGGANVCDCKTQADCTAQDDGNLCNGLLFCDTATFPHKCKLDAATVVSCDPGADTACAKAACAPATGKCSLQPVPDGALCEDGQGCTVSDVCKSGTCQAGTDVCACQATADCAAKEDGNLCNGTLVCDKAKVPYQCVLDAKTVVTCSSAGDTACAKNQCQTASGQCSLLPVADGSGCSDGSACSQGDACQGGACVGSAIACNDGNGCTNDSCDTAKGCVYAANTAPCDDGNACTTADACQASACSGGPALACTDGNACTTDTCDKAKGCQFAANSLGCDDGDACTLADVCQGGKCTGGAGPTCGDKAKNGAETGVDCGGQTGACGQAKCGPCGADQGCQVAADCQSGVCTGGKCAAPACSDKVKNGSEEQVDCGGGCPICPTLFLIAGGANTQAATRTATQPWQLAALGVPTVDGVAVAPLPGKAGAVGLVRYTKLFDLLDNTLQYTIGDGKGWSAAKPLGSGITTRAWPAATRAGAASHVAFQGQDYKHYFAAFDGQAWSAVEAVGAPQGYGPAPGALAFGNGKTTFAYVDGGNANHVSARDRTGGVWGPVLDVAAAPDFNIPPTLVAPASTAELLVVAVLGDGQVVWQSRSGTWTAAKPVPQAFTKHRVALANTGDGKVMLAMAGTDAKVYTALWTPATGTWSAPAQVGSPAATTTTTPALATGLGTGAELAWIAADGSLYHATWQDGAWSAPALVAKDVTSVALTLAP